MEFVISNKPIEPTSKEINLQRTGKAISGNQDDYDKLKKDFDKSFSIGLVCLFDIDKHLRVSDDLEYFKLKRSDGHNTFFKSHYSDFFEEHRQTVRQLFEVVGYINNNELVTVSIKLEHIYFTHSKDFTKSCVIHYENNFGIVEELTLYAEQLGYKKD